MKLFKAHSNKKREAETGQIENTLRHYEADGKEKIRRRNERQHDHWDALQQ